MFARLLVQRQVIFNIAQIFRRNKAIQHVIKCQILSTILDPGLRQFVDKFDLAIEGR